MNAGDQSSDLVCDMGLGLVPAACGGPCVVWGVFIGGVRSFYES